MYYILKGRKIKAVSSTAWETWFGNVENRRVGSTYFPGGRVSTVFVGLEPIYFETMVFGGLLDDYQWRYWDYKQAKAGHYRIVKQVQFLVRLHNRKRRNKRMDL